MESTEFFLEKVKLGGKQSRRNMTLFPLLASDAGEPDYLILEEAPGQGAVEITEMSQGGSVPDLKLINKSPSKLLVVDGEELVGAKQNRIVNATFLIGRQTEITIPVSCVEQGRWAYQSQKFSSGEKVMPPSMRREHQKVVAMSLDEGSGCRSNQGMIWNEIALKSERMAAHSATGAMADLFEGQKDRLGGIPEGFPAGGLPGWRSVCNKRRGCRPGMLRLPADLHQVFPKTGTKLRPGCSGLAGGSRETPGIQRIYKAFLGGGPKGPR
jgi:hypothetical protein